VAAPRQQGRNDQPVRRIVRRIVDKLSWWIVRRIEDKLG
jgi:hypothetical protein